MRYYKIAHTVLIHKIISNIEGITNIKKKKDIR